MTEPDRWHPGQPVTRREILGFEPTNSTDRAVPWYGRSWLDLEARVVKDEPDELVLYVERDAPFTFPDFDWPVAGGTHPWAHRSGWAGPGCLMLHRPGEHHAIWHFWSDPDHDFVCWYLNVQTAYRRHATTFETQDLELDFVIRPDLTWEVKDWDAVDERVREGRYSPTLGAWIHDYGRALIERLEQDGPWWDRSWVDYLPPAEW